MANKSQELRRLMKQQKQTSKKINHPLVKYNNLDQIVCIICNTVIKNEIIWNAHLQSRKHKENVVSLKTKPAEVKKTGKTLESKPKSILKKDSSYDEPPSKKAKGPLPDNFFDNPNDKNAASDEIVEKPNNEAKTESTGQLPKGFFDDSIKQQNSDKNNESSGVKKADSDADNKNRKSSTSTDNLPEGFFDDPKKDAKARNVEYVDPQDLEWEKFQKMIQEETKVADEIREEEDEEAEMMKDMAEYNNMKSCLSRVEALKSLVKSKQQNQMKANIEEDIKTENNENDSSDDEIDGIFDWRAKMA